MHWSDRYIGMPWTGERCCGFYFALVQREVFQRGADPERVAGIAGARQAARVMAAICADPAAARQWGYRPTDRPADGDAVFLTRRRVPHHIGTVAVIDGRMHVLHALEGIGVVRSDTAELAANHWRTAGFWSWK